MSAQEIAKNVYSVGAIDSNRRNFHGYAFTTPRGLTYNSYLIVDEKIALIDTVLDSFAGELIENIKKVLDPKKIDYIIVNHIEKDHASSLPKIMELCPKAKLFGTAKCKEGLERDYRTSWDSKIVKTGEQLKLGKKTLTFIEAPMIHWPDSMFTYLNEEAILFSNDAFGQHLATQERFDDEVDQDALMDEAVKYFAHILWPLSALIVKKIDEIKKLNISIKMIAPSHGIIWRKDPGKIINSYLSWANNETKKKAVVLYETMWGSTGKMADKIAEGLIDSKIDTKVFDITKTTFTEIIGEMLDARAYIVGSSTHDNDMLSLIAGFLHLLRGLKPKNRVAGVFGSYGWAERATKNIEKELDVMGIETVLPALQIQSVPDEAGLKQCYEFGKEFAPKI